MLILNLLAYWLPLLTGITLIGGHGRPYSLRSFVFRTRTNRECWFGYQKTHDTLDVYAGVVALHFVLCGPSWTFRGQPAWWNREWHISANGTGGHHFNAWFSRNCRPSDRDVAPGGEWDAMYATVPFSYGVSMRYSGPCPRYL